MAHKITEETLTEDDKAILCYLQKQNRPYSATDIASNLQKDLSLSKAATAKILSSLEASGLITSKTYGKTVIYVARQNDLGLEEKESREQLESNLTGLKEQRQTFQERVDEIRKQLKLTTETLTNEDLEYQISQISKHLRTMKDELALFESGTFEPVDTTEVEKSRQKLTLLKNQSKQGEKAFRQMWALVRDNVSDPDSSWEELGLE